MFLLNGWRHKILLCRFAVQSKQVNMRNMSQTSLILMGLKPCKFSVKQIDVKNHSLHRNTGSLFNQFSQNFYIYIVRKESLLTDHHLFHHPSLQLLFIYDLVKVLIKFLQLITILQVLIFAYREIVFIIPNVYGFAIRNYLVCYYKTNLFE